MQGANSARAYSLHSGTLLYFRMRPCLWIASLLTLLFASCETRQPVATAPAPPVVAALAAPVAPVPRPVARLLRDTVDVSSFNYDDAANAAVLDTLLRLGTRHYRLRLQAQPDSSQELKALPQDQVGVDSVAVGSTADDRLILGPQRHYNVRYTITLLDSMGRRQFRCTFTKPDFYQLVGRELVRESEPIRPALIGYNAPRQWLLLRQEFMAEGTDWGGELFLALDLKGRTQRLTLSNVYGDGGSDCCIQQSPDGQAVITCEELLLPGGRHQSLAKPHTELVAARFLSDTTLLAVYEYVTTRRVQYDGVWGNENTPDPRRRRVPNAFVLSARTGRVLASFRSDGAVEALGYHLPLHYVWQTNTYYLTDGVQQVLRVIPKDKPQLTYQVSYRRLPTFKLPRHPREIKVELNESLETTVLYIDTLTHALRRLKATDDH